MEPVSFVLYRSETVIRPGSADARQILAEARDRNARLGLSGFLHHEENFFFQWFEGPAEAVEEVESLITRDPRHSKMAILWRGTLDDRQFGQWKMGYSTADDDSILAWMAANPVAQREKRAYAASVLNFLQVRNSKAPAS